MTTEENKACSRRVFEEVWNQGRLDVIDEIFAPDFILHEPVAGEIRGPEGYRKFVAGHRAAFPDIHFTVEEQVAEGNMVVNRLTYTATHRGELMGIPPTGMKVTVMGMTCCRYGGGRMSEAWASSDVLGMLRQLGVLPPLGAGGERRGSGHGRTAQ